MNDTLEFNEIYQEVKGSWVSRCCNSLLSNLRCHSWKCLTDLSLQNDGRIRFSKQTVVYKNSKTGKVDSIPVPELTQAQWRRVCLGHGIKLCTGTGNIYKYDGFKDTVSLRYKKPSIKVGQFALYSTVSS